MKKREEKGWHGFPIARTGRPIGPDHPLYFFGLSVALAVVKIMSSVQFATNGARSKSRVAILGAGFISDFHIRSLQQLDCVEAVAICDADPAKAQKAARAWSIGGSFSNLEEMIHEAKVDAVHILVPPALHKQTAVSCLEAGCDVFLEKPVAVSTDECETIADAAERSGRTVGVNYNAVFQPAFRRAVKTIRERRIGRVQHVTAFLNVPLRQLTAGQHSHWMFAEPGNIVLEQGPHPFAQIQFLLGSILNVSSAPGSPVRLKTGGAFYDAWQIFLTCERGTAQCYLSFGKGFFDSWIHIVGEDGSLLVDLPRNTVRLQEKSRFMEPVDNFLVAARNAVTTVGQSGNNLLNYALGFLKLRQGTDAFYQSMAGSIRAWHESRLLGTPWPGTLQQASEVVRVCEAVAEPVMEQSMAMRYVTHA